jgi:hypothetical protein
MAINLLRNIKRNEISFPKNVRNKTWFFSAKHNSTAQTEKVETEISQSEKITLKLIKVKTLHNLN